VVIQVMVFWVFVTCHVPCFVPTFVGTNCRLLQGNWIGSGRCWSDWVEENISVI